MTQQAKQMEMFGEMFGDAPTARASRGGFSRSVVFHDYESFIKKFSDNPKTTDDCFTPQDVYEADSGREVDTAAACRILGKSAGAVNKMVQRGQLTARKADNGRLRYKLTELTNYYKNN